MASGFRLHVDTGQGQPSLSSPGLKCAVLEGVPWGWGDRGPAPHPPAGPDSASLRRGLPGLPLCRGCQGSGSLAQELRWLQAIKGMLVFVYCSAGSACDVLFCFLHTERKAFGARKQSGFLAPLPSSGWPEIGLRGLLQREAGLWSQMDLDWFCPVHFRYAFELCCWRRLLRVPWTAKRSNQSILKEINPEYSLEGLMLKLQYFGHLVQRANSLKKTLMLGKIERRRRRGRQRMRWLDGITNSMGMSLTKLQESKGQKSLLCCSPLGRKE